MNLLGDQLVGTLEKLCCKNYDGCGAVANLNNERQPSATITANTERVATSWSWSWASSTRILAAGCSTSSMETIVAPSFVTVTS